MSMGKAAKVRSIVDEFASGRTRMILDKQTGTGSPLPVVAWRILKPGQRMLVLCGNSQVARQQAGSLRRSNPAFSTELTEVASTVAPTMSVGPLGSDCDIVVASWSEFSRRQRPDAEHHGYSVVYMGERYPEHERMARNAMAPFLSRADCVLIEERGHPGSATILSPDEHKVQPRGRLADPSDPQAHAGQVLARIVVNAGEYRGVEMDEARRARLADMTEQELVDLVIRLTREPDYALEDEFPLAPRR